MSRAILFFFLSFLLVAQMIPASLQCCVANQCASLSVHCDQEQSAPVTDPHASCCAKKIEDGEKSHEAQSEIKAETTAASDCCKPYQQQSQTWTALHQDGLQTLSQSFVITTYSFQSPIIINTLLCIDSSASARIRPALDAPLTTALLSTRCVRLLI